MEIIDKIKRFFCADTAETNSDSSANTYKLNPEILREYDIRGIYNDTLSDQDAYFIGRAFSTYLVRKNLKKVCVGLDCRISSPSLAQNLSNGLRESGAEVIFLGTCHTPLMYYTVNKLQLDAGIMVTGSHNPPDYNGFKLVVGTDPFYSNDIRKLGDMIEQRDFHDGNGREIIMNKIASNYIADLTSDFSFSSDLKIAWDIGNGATSAIIKALSAKIPGYHHLLFEEMDGTFPNRQPDPTTPGNIDALCRLVNHNEFDIGFAFDSDGDRLAVVNKEGQVLYSDQVLEVFAKNFLQKNPGAQVVADVKCCNRLFDSIRTHGGIGLMEKAGHSFIKARMKATGALLAGEMSGHFFFKDRWFGFDDGIYAALRCLEILSSDHEAFSNIPCGFVSPELRIDCNEKFFVIEELRKTLKNQPLTLSEIDGLRVTTEHGWWLIRASNTQNALSLRLEADSAEHMQQLKQEIVQYLEVYIPSITGILSNA